MTDWLLPLAAGFGAGILSAWGIGGGTLLLLVMALLLDVMPEQAAAINLLYFLPTAAMSLLSHYRNGLLDLPLLRRAVPWAAAAALAASLIATRLDTSLLRRPFGVYLLLAAGTTLYQLWQSRKRP